MAFIAGLACARCLRFTQPLLNDLFGAAVLSLPFLALRPLSQLPRIPKIIGRIVLAPVVLFSLLFALFFVACGDWKPGRKNCLQEIGSVQQNGYSVHLLSDGCGGALAGFMLLVEQRMPLLPGLYLVRSVDVFVGAYEGHLTTAGANEIRIQIPKGVPGTGWQREIEYVYKLKPHVYF
jgi:hypothetical protein